MGKTAFAAHVAVELSRTGRLLAGHFRRFVDARRSDPVEIVKSLACQVANEVPGVARAVWDAWGALDKQAPAAQWCQR